MQPSKLICLKIKDYVTENKLINGITFYTPALRGHVTIHAYYACTQPPSNANVYTQTTKKQVNKHILFLAVMLDDKLYFDHAKRCSFLLACTISNRPFTCFLWFECKNLLYIASLSKTIKVLKTKISYFYLR